jgi:hypothetical protein
MTNKTLGIGLLISLGLAILTVVFEAGMYHETAESLYSLAGIGMLFFGIWGGVRLLSA